MSELNEDELTAGERLKLLVDTNKAFRTLVKQGYIQSDGDLVRLTMAGMLKAADILGDFDDEIQLLLAMYCLSLEKDFYHRASNERG